MKKNLKRLLSLVLATTLLLLPSARSVSAQADDDITTTPTTEVMQDDSVFQTEAANPGITEVVSRREENVKHFDMGDGTYQAVAYARPIHELDSEGNWQNIETGLQLSSTGSAACYTADQMGVTFAQRIGSTQPLMALNEAGNSISLNFVPSQTSLTRSSFASLPATVENASVKTEQTHFETFEEATNIDLSSSITYSEVQPNTDIEYVVEPGLVKENIIVKDSRNSYIYDFSLNLTGLYPAMLNDGSILIYDSDTDEMCYAIPAPYMYDALGNLSEDVWYTLSGANGSYTLTVEASAAWINDSNRTFPVTIDPTIYSDEDGVGTGIDTFIDVARPDEIFGLRQSLWVRMNDTMITYIDPPTLSIPTGVELLSARLECRYYYYDYVTTGSVTAGAYQMCYPWVEEEFDWTAASQNENNGLDSVCLSTAVAYGGTVIKAPGRLSFDITDAAKRWIETPANNHGIAIKYESGSNWSFAIRSYQSGDYTARTIYEYSPRKVMFIGIPDTTENTNHDHISSFYTCEHILRNIEETEYMTFCVDRSLEKDEFGSYLTNPDISILAVHCHGHKFSSNTATTNTGAIISDLRFKDETTVFSSSDVKDNMDLSHLQLVVFLACECGAGGKNNENNIVSKVHKQGARTVVGFEGIIDCQDSNDWIIDFFEMLATGKTVAQACAELSSKTIATDIEGNEEFNVPDGDGDSGLNNFVICGDGAFTLAD